MGIADIGVRGQPRELFDFVERLRDRKLQVNIYYHDEEFDDDDGCRYLTVESDRSTRYKTEEIAGDLCTGGGMFLLGDFECDGRTAKEVRDQLAETVGEAKMFA